MREKLGHISEYSENYYNFHQGGIATQAIFRLTLI